MRAGDEPECIDDLVRRHDGTHHSPGAGSRPLKSSGVPRGYRGLLTRVKYRATADAVSTGGSRPAKSYRGSRRRVKRLKSRGNFSFEMWVLAAWVIFLLLVVLPWMIRHSR